jgi:release factor glutamine methyltransferase
LLIPHTIQSLLARDTARLAHELGLDASTARIEVQCLLQKVLHQPRAWLLAHPEAAFDVAQQAEYAALLLRRLAGEPVAYILDEREFFGLMFKVTRATLIPRPETELLVELALQRCGRVAASPPGTNRPPPCGDMPEQARVLDLGTGSGAIALAIAHACPAAQVLACDASPDALAVAQENMQRLGIHNVTLLQSDWYAALGAQRFDLIVSNPPYVAAGDPHLLQGDVRFEPASALASGADGLQDIRHIVSGAHAHLVPGGWLLLEHGYDQAAQVRELLQAAGFSEVFSARDLAGVERVSGGKAIVGKFDGRGAHH